VGDVTVKAAGSGGIAETSFLATSYQNGDGSGGTATIGITGGTTTLSNLVVDASGTGSLAVRPLPGVASVNAFAVTLEPAGGLPAPSGAMYLLVKS